MSEYILDGLTIKEHLLKLSKDGNKPFSKMLNPGIDNVLGIRIPSLRELAKRIYKDDWKHYLETADTHYMEERMLTGMVISNIKIKDCDEYLKLVDKFVPIINSWSVCDTFDFYGKDKFVRKNEEKIWDYLLFYMHTNKEYQIRFGVVMGLSHFVTKEYVEIFLSELEKIKHDGYYVKMAIAWAVSVCFVKFPNTTYQFLKKSSLDPFIHNKSIQKIIESLRATDEQKESVRKLKMSIK